MYRFPRLIARQFPTILGGKNLDFVGLNATKKAVNNGHSFSHEWRSHRMKFNG